MMMEKRKGQHKNAMEYWKYVMVTIKHLQMNQIYFGCVVKEMNV